MRSRIVPACLSLAFCVSAAIAGAGVPMSLTAEQVVRKNVEARGGEGAWLKISTMTMSGRMDISKGVQVPYTIEMKRGRKVRVEITFGGKTAIQVFDGTNGWKIRPFLGRTDAEPFTADEAQKATLDSDIDGPLIGYAAKGTRIHLEGMEKVEGRDAYKLKLTLKNGQEQQVWIDAQTYLECKIDGSRRMDGKIRAVSTYYRNYREVNGVKVPYEYETEVDGVKTANTIVVQTVVLNPKLDDSMFAKLK